MSKDDKAIFYHKPQTFQWTPADGVFSFGENRKEQNMIRYYSVPKETFVTNGTIVEPLNVTENGTYAPPAGTAYSPVVVNVEGGGGSSDFSTAEVTSSNDSEENLSVTLIGEIGPSMESVIVSNLKAGRTASAVLYKDHQYVALGSKTATINSGSAEIITITDPMFGDMKFLDITGDCTITIS